MSTTEIKNKIKDGKLVLGTFLMELDTPGTAQILKNSGLEFVVLDMEHGGFGIETIKRMVRNCIGAGIAPFVRVPVGQSQYVARVMDLGAKGVIIPMTESAEQISHVVQHVKYFPEGRRGTAFGIAHDNYQVTDVSTVMQTANAETMVIALIETAKGIEHLEAIIQVDHVDLIWVGHYDLSQSLGIPGKFEHPLFTQAMEHVLAMCRKYKKPCGRLVSTVEQALYWKDKGFTCISYGSDISILSEAIRQAVASLQ